MFARGSTSLILLLALLLLGTQAHGAVTGWSASNFYFRDAVVVNTYPFMFSAWVYRNATSGNGTIVAADLTSDNNQRQGQFRLSALAVQAGVMAGTGTFVAASAGNVTQDTWTQVSAAYVSTTLREARRSGGNLGTETSSRSPTAANRLRIGKATVGENLAATDAVAEVSIWDLTGFSEANRTSLDAKLAAGENPLTIDAESGQPWSGMLLAYWPLTAHTDLTDETGNGHTLSTNGTLSTFGSHPTIDPPGGGPTSQVIVID